MEIVVSKYKKVADFCYKLFRIAELRLFSNKFSKKVYAQYQHLFLLVYRQYRKFTYKELFEDLYDNLTLRAYLGLNKLPDYTTLVKFAKRIPSFLFDKITGAFSSLIEQPGKVVLDSTGISLDNASPHYCKRIGLKTSKRPFLKMSLIVEIKNYLILVSKMRKKTRHDLVDGVPLVKKLAKDYSPEVFYADRGYDSEEMFKTVFEDLKAYPLILQKRLDVPKHRRRGLYRKKTVDVFDYGEYLQRNKGETGIGIFKKRHGFSIRAKVVKIQKVEALCRVIAHNIDRLIESGMTILLEILIKMRISY
ncbi:transposase [Candidatus Woesearchaeota archaeon]|nr:transposase [Candidatus Woesearchaeota archaeon]